MLFLEADFEINVGNPESHALFMVPSAQEAVGCRVPRQNLGFGLNCKSMCANGVSSAVAAAKLSALEVRTFKKWGLQLANFIIADRGIAVEILANALTRSRYSGAGRRRERIGEADI
jgi:hypothetical protein